MDPDEFVAGLVKAAGRSDRKLYRYLDRHDIPITFAFAAAMTTQSEAAAGQGDLPRLTALLRVRTILMGELANASEVIAPSLRQLWIDYVEASDTDGLDWIAAQAREIAVVARHVGEHRSSFGAAVLAANCGYFIAEGPPNLDTLTRGSWLLAALVDAADAARHYDPSAGATQFHQFLSLLESLVDRSETQVWPAPDENRRVRECLETLAEWVGRHVPADYEFPAEEARRSGADAALRSHRIALALAKLSRVRTAEDGTRRLRVAMRRADVDGDVDRWLAAARLLHTMAPRSVLRQEISRRAETIRGRYRSRLGRLWAAYRQESILGPLLRAALDEPDGPDDEVFRTVEAIKARTVLDDLAELHRPLPEEADRESDRLERSLVTFADSPQRGVVVEELRHVSALPLTLATNRGGDGQAVLRDLEDLHQRHGAGYTGTAQAPTLADVQATLGPGELLVEFIVPADPPEPIRRVWLLAITHESVERLACPVEKLPDDWLARQVQIDGQQPLDGGPLLSPIVDLRRAIRLGEDQQAQPLLRLLHDVLVAPLLTGGRTWDGVRRLITVPHGPLHMVPWPALTDPDGRRLIEHVPLVTVPSAAVWYSLARRAPEPSDSALLVGAPVLPDRPPLNYAVAEIDEVAAALPGMNVTRLTGSDATETAFREKVAGQGIVHVATHGRFPEQNPLRLHQLELSADTTSDGVVDAETLRRLDLRSARLVVLNLCDGGLYRFGPGDEPYGIVPALLSAGTRAVVAPTWPVDDRKAATFMADFHRSLPGSDPADSLRRAMVARIDGFLLRDWSGYVLVGAVVSDYDILFDPNASAEHARPLDLPEGASVLTVADALDREFARDPSVRLVLVRLGGVPIGVANRTHTSVSRGAPPTSLDECPECYAAGRHELWCSAAPPAAGKDEA